MSENKELFLNQKTREFVLQRAKEKKNGKKISTLSEIIKKMNENNSSLKLKQYLRNNIADFNQRLGKMNLQELKDELVLTKVVVDQEMKKITGNHDGLNMKLSVYVRRARFLSSLISQMEENQQTQQ